MASDVWDCKSVITIDYPLLGQTITCPRQHYADRFRETKEILKKNEEEGSEQEG